jgi:hypothetical protein
MSGEVAMPTVATRTAHRKRFIGFAVFNERFAALALRLCGGVELRCGVLLEFPAPLHECA